MSKGEAPNLLKMLVWWKKLNIIDLKMDKKNIIKCFQEYMKMDKNIPAFGDNEMEKNKFHCHQTPTLINNIDIDTKIVSNKVPFGK